MPTFQHFTFKYYWCSAKGNSSSVACSQSLHTHTIYLSADQRHAPPCEVGLQCHHTVTKVTVMSLLRLHSSIVDRPSVSCCRTVSKLGKGNKQHLAVRVLLLCLTARCEAGRSGKPNCRAHPLVLFHNSKVDEGACASPLCPITELCGRMQGASPAVTRGWGVGGWQGPGAK